MQQLNILDFFKVEGKKKSNFCYHQTKKVNKKQLIILDFFKVKRKKQTNFCYRKTKKINKRQLHISHFFKTKQKNNYPLHLTNPLRLTDDNKYFLYHNKT